MKPFARMAAIVCALLLIPAAVVVGAVQLWGSAPSEPVASTGQPNLAPGGIPLSFIQNRGQADPRIDYYLQRGDTSVSFTSEGLVLGLQARDGTSQRWNLGLDFLAARSVEPRGMSESPTLVSYFTGPSSEWRTGIPTFSELAYRDLWPGIDLVYSSSERGLKYSFVVQPGADPRDIRLDYRGATSVGVNAGGQLEATTPVGVLVDEVPYSYQEIDGRQTEVSTRYAVDGSSFGFRVGAYDRARTIVIDPTILLYSGFVGGSNTDRAIDIEVGPDGSAFVVGQTASSDFPAAVGPDTSHGGGSSDAFVGKLAPDGSAFAYLGFIGGDDLDIATGIAVDQAGAAYVTGITESASGFPVVGTLDPSFNGIRDNFITKIHPSGTSVVYSGYLGGPGFDNFATVAIDGTGAAYLSGNAEAGFPSMGGPKPSVEGPEDAFVAKVNPAGSALVYSGFVGGAASEFATGVALDPTGAVYLVGQSTSPTITGAPVGPDPSGNGSEDGFVAKVSPDGSALLYGGFIGGTGHDDGRDIAVDRSGRAYVVGVTNSDSGFPAVVGPDLSLGGPSDGYVAGINPAGTGFDFAGFVGGASEDTLRGVALAPNDVLYLGGASASGQFAPPGRKLLGITAGNDAFVATVPTSGSAVTSLRLIGGSDGDAASAIALDRAANAYLVGDTQSTSGFPAVVGPDLDYNGGHADGFVAKMQTLERCKGRPVTHLGSNAKDVVAGTGKADVVLALGGNDRVTTKGGNDRVCGGKGNDRVKAGGGKDLVLGQGGRDDLNGGPGRGDKCVGGAGKDAGKLCERGRV